MYLTKIRYLRISRRRCTSTTVRVRTSDRIDATNYVRYVYLGRCPAALATHVFFPSLSSPPAALLAPAPTTHCHVRSASLARRYSTDTVSHQKSPRRIHQHDWQATKMEAWPAREKPFSVHSVRVQHRLRQWINGSAHSVWPVPCLGIFGAKGPALVHRSFLTIDLFSTASLLWAPPSLSLRSF